MADIRQPFPQPPSTGRELAARPNFTIPGEAPYPRSGPPQSPPGRAMPAADAAAYNASPEGRATARQFAQEKFTQAGGGSKYVPPTNPAAGPTGAAPKPAMPSTGGFRRAAEGAKTWATSPGVANKPIGEATKGLVKGAGTLAGGVKSLITSPLVVASAGIYGAYDGFNTDTEQYAKRFGMENTEPGMLRDLGVRSLGVASDVGNALFLGAPKALGLYRDVEEAKQVAAQPPTASAAPTAAATPAPTAAATPAPAPIPTADPNIGPHPDLTQALASVPQNMPAGLRDGAVYKTKDANGRTVYSGTNVKQGADMIDGQGKPVGSLRDTYGPSSVQPAAQEQYSIQPTAAQPGAPAQQPAAQGQAPAQQPAAQGQAPVTTVNKATDAAGNSTRPAAAAQPAAATAQPAAATARPAAATAQPAAATAQPAAAAQPAGPSLDFDTSRGAVTTLPKGISPFASSFGLGGSDAAISQARQAAADRGDWDAVSRSYGEAPQGGQGGPSLRMGGGGYSAGPSVAPHVAQSEKFAQQVARSNAESAAMAAIKSGSVRERGRGMATLAQLAGGDQDAATSRYNTDATTATSRYTSDNSLRGSVYSTDAQNASSRYTADMGLRGAYAKNMPAQAQRQAQAMAMQMAGGDIPTALKLMAQYGYSGEGLIATQGALNSDQTTQQNLSEGARKAAVARFGQFMQTDEDGKPVAGAEGALLNSMESIVPGSTQMREDELAAPIRLPDGTEMTRQAALTAGLNILKGLNTTKDNAFLQTVGWDPANPRLDQLPDLNGAKLDRVGWAKGKVKGGNVEPANYELDLGGGRKLYLPHDQIGENELALLRARGVNVPK